MLGNTRGCSWTFVDVRGHSQSTLEAPGALIQEPPSRKTDFLTRSVSERVLVSTEHFTNSKRFLHSQSNLHDTLEHLGPLGFQNNTDHDCVRASIETVRNNFRRDRSKHHFDRNLHLGTSTIDHERPQPSRVILHHHKPSQDALWAPWMFVDVVTVDGSCVEEMT